MNVRQQLKFFLKSKSISAAELSRRSGVSKQTISSWLSGKQPRDVCKIKAIADALETTIDNLLYGTGGTSKSSTSKNLVENLAKLQDEKLTGLFEVEIKMVRK